jgi:hypothetical protein
MSFPLFLMLAAIILKLGRIADRVDPQPTFTYTPPKQPWTWKRIKATNWIWQILWIPMVVAGFGGVLLILAGAHLLFVDAQYLLFG